MDSQLNVSVHSEPANSASLAAGARHHPLKPIWFIKRLAPLQTPPRWVQFYEFANWNSGRIDKGSRIGWKASYNVILRAFVAIPTSFANVLLHISRFVSRPMGATEQACLRARRSILIAIPSLVWIKRARLAAFRSTGTLGPLAIAIAPC